MFGWFFSGITGVADVCAGQHDIYNVAPTKSTYSGSEKLVTVTPYAATVDGKLLAFHGWWTSYQTKSLLMYYNKH